MNAVRVCLWLCSFAFAVGIRSNNEDQKNQKQKKSLLYRCTQHKAFLVLVNFS